GGTLWQPHLLKQVVDSQGKVVATPAPQMIRKLDITQENLRLLRESARRVVTIGHAYMPNAKLPIAGKTGTAEFGAATGKDGAGRDAATRPPGGAPLDADRPDPADRHDPADRIRPRDDVLHDGRDPDVHR